MSNAGDSGVMKGRIFAEALAKERERRNVTDWRPTLLNGSADIDGYVDKKMRPLWEEQRHKVSKNAT